jgi:deoxycytidylate deaminase
MKQCLKQSTVAIIMKDNKIVSTRANLINNIFIEECPRKHSLTGTDYDKCKDVCLQEGHAEEVACRIAGKECGGGILYLIGHTYACDDCIKIMKEHGIKKLIICDTKEEVNLYG